MTTLELEEGPLLFDRNYVYRHVEPANPHARTIVALHGSNANEMAILPLARLLDPEARVIAPRGRIMQNGERRWYRKKTAISFDQPSIQFESEAFARFLDGLARDRLLDPERTLYLGYSNGANLLGALMLLQPGRVRRAVLMRSMPVLDAPPQADLSTTRVLILSGDKDRIYGSYGTALADLLRRNGATVTRDTLSAGHECGRGDIIAAQNWLGAMEGVADTAGMGPPKG